MYNHSLNKILGVKQIKISGVFFTSTINSFVLLLFLLVFPSALLRGYWLLYFAFSRKTWQHISLIFRRVNYGKYSEIFNYWSYFTLLFTPMNLKQDHPDASTKTIFSNSIHHFLINKTSILVIYDMGVWCLMGHRGLADCRDSNGSLGLPRRPDLSDKITKSQKYI